jgi:hypothetical protein
MSSMLDYHTPHLTLPSSLWVLCAAGGCPHGLLSSSWRAQHRSRCVIQWGACAGGLFWGFWVLGCLQLVEPT